MTWTCVWLCSHHLFSSISLCDAFRAYSEQWEDDVNIPSRTLDSRANSIGLTPPCSCGTCPQAFHTTACLSECLVLSDGASSLHNPPPPPPPQSLTPITSEEQSDAQDQQQPGLFFPGSVWPPSNMFPARRRGRRTGYSTVAPRTMVTARRTGQVGQVWVSCWILLSATCILSAQAQGKMRNSGFILDT